MALNNCLNPNRIQVDLKYIYNDHRKKAYVSLSKFEKVIDLQEHIQRLFSITGEVYLTTEDHLLPPMETICVIHPTDIIIVHPVNPFTQLAAALSHAHINSETTPINEMPSPGFPKRKKKRLDDDSVATGKRSNWIDDVNSLDVTVAVTDTTEEVEQPEKLKRKRTRKRKNKTAVVSPPTKPQPRKPISFVKAEQEPQSTFKKRTVHFRFEGDTDSCSGDDMVTEQSVVKDVVYPATARMIRAKVVKVEQHSTSQVITPTLPKPTNSETSTPTKISVSETVIVNSNDVNASNMDMSSSEKPITVEEASDMPSVELLRQNLHNMVLSSAVGLIKDKDVIAFKMYKMGENYMPELSEFIIGIIQDMTSEEEVTINVLAGFEQTKEPGGRFSMKEDDEEAEEDVAGVGTLTMRLADILEPKFVNLNV